MPELFLEERLAADVDVPEEAGEEVRGAHPLKARGADAGQQRVALAGQANGRGQVGGDDHDGAAPVAEFDDGGVAGGTAVSGRPVRIPPGVPPHFSAALPTVPPGTYTIKISLAGFQTYTRTGVIVAITAFQPEIAALPT